MGQKIFIPEQHVKARSFFRLLGPVLLLIGGACMLVALVDFFTIQGFEEPKFFWLFFVAIPLLFSGFVVSGLGYGGTVAKYQSREYAPVAKDTFNYLAKETTPGVKDITNAIQRGGGSKLELPCHNCQKPNASHAKFCSECGDKLAQVCGQCEHVNSYEARFCNHCGNTLEK